jgi:hypothetical protein
LNPTTIAANTGVSLQWAISSMQNLQ